MKFRRLGGIAVAGAVAVGGMLAPQAHAAVTIRSALTLVGGEDPTIDPLTPALAEARWASPVRRIDIIGLDPARFPVSAATGGPCVTNMSVGSLSGQAAIIADVNRPGLNTAGLRDAGPGADGELSKVDIVCDFVGAGGVLEHHETHWAGELGTAAVSSVSGNVNFGSVRVPDATADQTVTLTNVGNVPMDVQAAELSGTGASQFAITSDLCAATTLDVNASCAVTVNFHPTKAGDAVADLVLAHTGVGPSSVSLSGLGLSPNIQITPNAVSFGSKTILITTSVQTLRVTNTGNMDLSLGAWSLTGDPDFKVVADSCSNTAVAAGGSCSVTLQFQPLLLGLRTAVLDAVSDAPDTAQHSVSISGTGNLIVI